MEVAQYEGYIMVTNTEILAAMDIASRQGRARSSLDSVARILGVEATPAFERQARNLATRSKDDGAKRFIEGRTRTRRY